MPPALSDYSDEEFDIFGATDVDEPSNSQSLTPPQSAKHMEPHSSQGRAKQHRPVKVEFKEPMAISTLFPTPRVANKRQLKASRGTKKPSLLAGLDPENIIMIQDENQQAVDASINAMPASSAPPSSYTTRSQTKVSRSSELVYDQRFHPMDDFVRPKRAAQLRSEYGEEQLHSDDPDASLEMTASSQRTRRSARQINRDVLYNIKDFDLQELEETIEPEAEAASTNPELEDLTEDCNDVPAQSEDCNGVPTQTDVNGEALAQSEVNEKVLVPNDEEPDWERLFPDPDAPGLMSAMKRPVTEVDENDSDVGSDDMPSPKVTRPNDDRGAEFDFQTESDQEWNDEADGDISALTSVTTSSTTTSATTLSVTASPTTSSALTRTTPSAAPAQQMDLGWVREYPDCGIAGGWVPYDKKTKARPFTIYSDPINMTSPTQPPAPEDGLDNYKENNVLHRRGRDDVVGLASLNALPLVVLESPSLEDLASEGLPFTDNVTQAEVDLIIERSSP
ncbi:hypothetical protein BCR34DRAFT_602653 [Clohesyomyces aquaticus]|uniref:Uncharacterized protein n=1 Tax=Clohesyomyces aquaticus TaxID=1231657 RepID=A0A1Y1ZHB4_9PLEO|nr:hypothetical protein BCR34DRAFT_602653 [Clohesyomyces aquaticus]